MGINTEEGADHSLSLSLPLIAFENDSMIDFGVPTARIGLRPPLPIV